MQARHRILGHPGDASAAQLAERVPPQACDVLAIEANAALTDPARRFEQAKYRVRRHRLARTALAHEPELFAARDLERNTGDGGEVAKTDMQLRNREQSRWRRARNSLFDPRLLGTRPRGATRLGLD